MTTDRDPRVGALLDLLEPVGPRPRFWAELEERLRSDAHAPIVLVPGPGPRARRRVVVALLAAAAVLAAVVGSLALRDDGTERRETVPVQPGPDASAPPTHATTEATVDPASAQGEALLAADLWIRRVAHGDLDASLELLGSQSREQIGGDDAFAAAMSDVATTYAPYANTPDRRELVAQLPGQPIFLVVLTVESEADALPPLGLLVRVEAEGPTTVEPFVPGPALDLIGVPSLGGTPLRPGADIPVHLAEDPDATSTAVVVDGLLVPESWLVRDGRGQVIGVRTQPSLALGVHWIAVAEVLPGGALTADSRMFEVGDLRG